MPTPQKTDDDIIKLLKQDMDKAKAYQLELSKQREEHYKWYRAEKYGNERTGWSQTVHPTIFSIVEWMKPGLVEIFTGDFFNFSPIVKDPATTKEAKASADKLKKYVKHKLFSQLDGEQVVEDFVHDCLTTHYGVVKVCHKDDWDIETIPVPRATEAEAAQLQQQPDVVGLVGGVDVEETDWMTGMVTRSIENATLVRRVSKYNGFHVEVIPASEYYELPGYKDIAKNPFVAHVVKRDLDYIRRQEMAGVYRQGSYDKLKAKIGTTESQADTAGEIAAQYSADDINKPEDNTDYADDSAKVSANEVWVWECYTRMALDETALLKPAIVTVCNDVVLREPIPNPYESPPFEKGFIYKEPHKAVGRPIPGIFDQQQRVLTNLQRGLQDSAAVSTYKSALTTDPRIKKVLGSLGPGEVGHVPSLNANALLQLEQSPPAPGAFNAFQLTLQEVSKESGVNENMQGLDNNSLNKTKGGMEMRMTAGMMRQKLYARRIARAFKRILGRILDIIRLYPPQDDVDLVGADIQLSENDIQARYSVDIEVGVGPQDRMNQANMMEGLIQFMVKVGLPAGMCGKEHVIRAQKAKGEYLDMDVSGYFFEEEQLNTLQQMQGQMQQLAAENQGIKQAIADHTAEMQGGDQGPPAPGGPEQGPPPGMMPPPSQQGMPMGAM